MINMKMKLPTLLMFFLVSSTFAYRKARSPIDEFRPTDFYVHYLLWPRLNLTYTLLGNVASKNQTKPKTVASVLRAAFDEWKGSSCFRFVDLTPATDADIKVIFANDKYWNVNAGDYYHRNCTRKFRRSGAAHAFFRSNVKYPAHIHVNNEIFWMESEPLSGSISLKTILMHEIGHVLGLFHSNDTNSVMYEYIYTQQVKRIAYADRLALNAHYKSLCKALYYNKRRYVALR